MIYKVKKQVLNFEEIQEGTSLFIVPSSLVEELIRFIVSKGNSVQEKDH